MIESNIFILHRRIADCYGARIKNERVESDRGGIWDLHEKGQSASCEECRSTVKCAGGSTSGLHMHLRTKQGHNMLLKCCTTDSSTESIISNNVKKSGQAGGPATKYLFDTKERSLEEAIA